MKSMKNSWYPEKGTVWNVCWIFWRKNRRGIAIFYHKEDWHCHFLPFEGCFLFYRRLSQIRHFQRKKGKLQQILSVIQNPWLLTFAPPGFTKATKEIWLPFLRPGKPSAKTGAEIGDSQSEACHGGLSRRSHTKPEEVRSTPKPGWTASWTNGEYSHDKSLLCVLIGMTIQDQA